MFLFRFEEKNRLGVAEAFKVRSPQAVSNISYPSVLIEANDLRSDLKERKKERKQTNNRKGLAVFV